jgi:excisionase family DNA binding protein
MSDVVAELMSTKDAANYLGLHHKTVEKMCREGGIEYIQIGERYRFKKADLDKFIEKKRKGNNKKVVIEGFRCHVAKCEDNPHMKYRLLVCEKDCMARHWLFGKNKKVRVIYEEIDE